MRMFGNFCGNEWPQERPFTTGTAAVATANMTNNTTERRAGVCVCDLVVVVVAGEQMWVG